MASSNIKIDTKGFEKLIAEIEKVTDSVEDVVDNALKKGGETLLDRMKIEVPVDTGRLKESLKVSDIKFDNRLKRYVRVGDVDYDSGYIWYVERQTNFMARSKQISRKEIRENIKQNLMYELMFGNSK